MEEIVKKIEDINPFGEYSEYTKIENHIEFSRQLFLIDKKGKNILLEMELKKYERKKRTGGCVFKSEADKVYTNLVHILNVKKFSHRLYFTLQFYMDELLFKEVDTCTKFYIEDSEYELTNIYFDQLSWITNSDIQEYQLEIGTEFNLNEAMYLTCFLRDFETLLFDIEEYISDLKNCRLKKILLNTLSRIRYKQKIIWNIVIEIINKTIKYES